MRARKPQNQTTFDINLKPALTPEALDKRLQKVLIYIQKQLINGMKDLLPSQI